MGRGWGEGILTVAGETREVRSQCADGNLLPFYRGDLAHVLVLAVGEFGDVLRHRVTHVQDPILLEKDHQSGNQLGNASYSVDGVLIYSGCADSGQSRRRKVVVEEGGTFVDGLGGDGDGGGIDLAV